MKNVSMTIRPVGTLFLSAALAAALAGCDREPEGQVVAVVDGDEITAQELNAELGGESVGQEQSQQAQNAALDKVIERRLMAEVAREEGVESSPEFILRRKKMEEILLVQMLSEKIAREVTEPTAQDVAKVISDNPQAFGDRTMFALDQVVFDTPQRPEVMRALAPTKSMDEVVKVLNRYGITFNRATVTLDSGNLPREIFEQFRKVGTSEPMIIPSGARVNVAKILAVRQTPVTGGDAQPVASSAFVKQATQKALEDRLAKARKEREVSYQTGFSAPKDNRVETGQGASSPQSNTAEANPEPVA